MGSRIANHKKRKQQNEMTELTPKAAKHETGTTPYMQLVPSAGKQETVAKRGKTRRWY